jgi:hypothetical protein
MEDADSDAEMADYGTDFSDDVDPNRDFDKKAFKVLSRIGNRIPRFPPFLGGGGVSRFPIGRESGIGKSPVSRFGREPGIGVPAPTPLVRHPARRARACADTRGTLSSSFPTTRASASTT